MSEYDSIKDKLLKYILSHPCRVMGAMGTTLISMSGMVGLSLGAATITGTIMFILAGIGISLLCIVLSIVVQPPKIII